MIFPNYYLENTTIVIIYQLMDFFLKTMLIYFKMLWGKGHCNLESTIKVIKS